ncbi:MAG: UDP-N-acetylmuramoyl-tripeptide--D-alanyl-D-alanine ligase [Thermincolia bacterium]
MYAMTINEITLAINGQLIQGDGDIQVSGVSTDTRKINPGDIFIALAGEHFDAYDFLAQAVDAGAAALVVSRKGFTGDVPVIMVDDTLKALQQLARHNRDKFGGWVVAITGSNGKTTTKDMITSVLSRKYNTLKTEGNLNNEIGLPLTLLKLGPEHQAAVVEMGMRGLGQISQLGAIAQPDLAVITNVSEVHLELLGTIDNIGRAKGEILDHLNPKGTAVLNGDDDIIRRESNHYQGKKVLYGFNENNQLRAINIEANETGSVYTATFRGEQQELNLPILGRHNVLNSLAAIGVGLELGLTWEQVVEGLGSLQLTGMRLELIETPRWLVINDAYNANTAATKAALQVLQQVATKRKSRKIAVLGNMFELGTRAVEGHREVGQTAVDVEADFLITVGDLAEEIAEGARLGGLAGMRIQVCRDNQDAVRVLQDVLEKGDTVLVKGSRGMKMEQIVAALTKENGF